MPTPIATITNLFADVDFGSRKSGLATVGYRLVRDDDTDSVARTTVGVFEVGTTTGQYAVIIPSVPTDAVLIQWDTGDVPLRFANETLVDILHTENNRKRLFNREETNPGTGVLTQFDDDGSTPLFTADIFEDVAAATPYNNAGINRRNELT